MTQHSLIGLLRHSNCFVSQLMRFVYNLPSLALPVLTPIQTRPFSSLHYIRSLHILPPADKVESGLVSGAPGVQFVAVHDSYWTHASTIDPMNINLREQFVHLHSQPLLPRLYEYLNMYHNGTPIPRNADQVSQQPTRMPDSSATRPWLL